MFPVDSECVQVSIAAIIVLWPFYHNSNARKIADVYLEHQTFSEWKKRTGRIFEHQGNHDWDVLSVSLRLRTLESNTWNIKIPQTCSLTRGKSGLMFWVFVHLRNKWLEIAQTAHASFNYFKVEILEGTWFWCYGYSWRWNPLEPSFKTWCVLGILFYTYQSSNNWLEPFLYSPSFWTM